MSELRAATDLDAVLNTCFYCERSNIPPVLRAAARLHRETFALCLGSLELAGHGRMLVARVDMLTTVHVANGDCRVMIIVRIRSPQLEYSSIHLNCAVREYQ